MPHGQIIQIRAITKFWMAQRSGRVLRNIIMKIDTKIAVFINSSRIAGEAALDSVISRHSFKHPQCILGAFAHCSMSHTSI